MIANSSSTAPESVRAADQNEQTARAGERAAFASLAYSLGYYVSFGVAYPTFWLARCVQVDSAIGCGVCDGAEAARDAHERFQQRAAAARNRIGDTYANAAAGIGRRVEDIQDSIAERKHRRRIVHG